MSVIAVDIDSVVLDIAHGENVKLLLSAAAGCIYREQNGPGDAGTQKGDNNHDFEESHKKVAVNRLVVQDVLILEIFKVFHPAK